MDSQTASERLYGFLWEFQTQRSCSLQRGIFGKALGVAVDRAQVAGEQQMPDDCMHCLESREKKKKKARFAQDLSVKERAGIARIQKQHP